MILESGHNQGYQKYMLIKTIKKFVLIAADSPFLEKIWRIPYLVVHLSILKASLC